MEQEMASLVKFITEHAGEPAPYYWNIPQHFCVPAVFFPTPEITSGGETFGKYYLDFMWHIKFFHSTEQGAHALAQRALEGIRAVRNLIPLIGEDGSIIPKEWVRVEDPSLKMLEGGAAQLTVDWRSRRPYNAEIAAKIQIFNLDVFMKAGRTISDEEAEALLKYAVPME